MNPTRLVGVGEARAEVVDQVQVAPLLHAAPCLSEGLLGDLVQLLPAQTQLVALVGAHHLLEDVMVVGGVPLRLRGVDEALDLTGEISCRGLGLLLCVRNTKDILHFTLI